MRKTNIPARSPHSFHIPVMGTGFTIDTPLRVAKFGINSVISIGDDILIEKMRKFHSLQNEINFEPISTDQTNYRSSRITAYLNLLKYLVSKQIETMKSEKFEPGTDLTQYFEMLPDSELKARYEAMLAMSDSSEKIKAQDQLRHQIIPGSIDVNIMTKVDFPVSRNNKLQPDEESVAFKAVRGFADSELQSSLVLSAGMNRRLFSFIAEFKDFYPDSSGLRKKEIVLKVSDYRSALLQGKLLAKLGLWVSEFRIESGLNCGGHAFATKGQLLGPILEEFKLKKNDLYNELQEIYASSISKHNGHGQSIPTRILITVQGGICTSLENEFLLKYYQVDSTGWGTPFLLVPEVTNVDPEHLNKLASANTDDVYLSDSSPLGVKFWSLRTSDSEEARRLRLSEGQTGVSCSKGYLMSNTECSELPICPASREYQQKRLVQLECQDLTESQKSTLKKKITDKVCLCMDLAAGVNLKNKLDKNATSAVCCGPSIASFSSITTLEKMISHIYGRLSLMMNTNRSHMFINELQLYINHLKDELVEAKAGILQRTARYFQDFAQNLESGIEYYRELANKLSSNHYDRFLIDLDKFSKEFEQLFKFCKMSIPALANT